MQDTTILLINPNTSLAMTRVIDDSAKRAASKTTKIITVSSKRGPTVLEGPVDEALSVPGMIEVAKKMEGQFHGIISACFGDPGIEALKFAFGVPVIGIRQSAFLIASLIGDTFSVIALQKNTERNIRHLVRLMGIEEKLLSVEAGGVTISDLESGVPGIEEAIYKAGKAAVDKGARSLIFCCAGMGRVVRKIESRLDVPCVNAVESAVKVMEGILYFCRGKIFKGNPFKDEITGYTDLFR
jgi:allantoin racemase